MMNYPIQSIPGICTFTAKKLKAEKIRTTRTLLERAGSAKARKQLAETISVSEQQLLEWANMADCLRINGMGSAKAELLRAAGVTTVRELVHRNPVRLAQSMKEANESRKLVRVPPSDTSIARLIQRARMLPLKITY